MSGPLLAVRDLKTWLRTPRGLLRAVDGVDFDVVAGRTLAIVGESGCGKSVLARSLLGLNPTAIEVRAGGIAMYGGRDLRALPERELRALRGRELAMIFQDPMTALNPVLSVGRQIQQVLRLHLGLARAAARERAVEMLDAVGIPSPRQRARQYPHELSGGQRQRVMIAIAVASNPKLLIADEPTTALDVTVQAQILELLARMQRERGMALMLITHNLGVVADVADDVAVMYAGRIVECGPTAQVLSQPRMPYTHGLLACVPRIDATVHARLPTIRGHLPALVNPPPGCRFASRCAHVQHDCRQREPTLMPDAAAHRHACWHPLDEAFA